MSRRILMRMTSETTAALLLDPAVDALKRLAADIRAEARSSAWGTLAAASRTVIVSRVMAAGALERLRDALPRNTELWRNANAQAAVLLDVVRLAPDVLDANAAAWLAAETGGADAGGGS
jgi:hypothetical protein